MRIVSRHPLSFEILTFDDGSKKVACDLVELQQLLGITSLQDLILQKGTSDEDNQLPDRSSISLLQSSQDKIPTIEDVIRLLDANGLKEKYEVAYRKQYVSILPKIKSERARVGIYVVQQQSSLALSIHEKIWSGKQICLRYSGANYPDYFFATNQGESEFEIRISEIFEKKNFDSFLLDAKTLGYFNADKISFWRSIIEDLVEEDMFFALGQDTRFPATRRIGIENQASLVALIDKIQENIKIFLESNGKKPEIIQIELQSKDDDLPF